MSNVFIFHGSEGYPEENWFPWLKEEIIKLGHECYVPQFPTPENQNPEAWLRVFEEYLPLLSSNSILVGHSCGANFTLRLLEKINIKVKVAYLVAGPVKPLNNRFDEMHMKFVDHPIDWEKVKLHSEHFYPIYSDNDPYVSIEHGEITAKELNAGLITIQNAGHFNKKAGYLKFDYLLDLIQKELNN